MRPIVRIKGDGGNKTHRLDPAVSGSADLSIGDGGRNIIGSHGNCRYDLAPKSLRADVVVVARRRSVVRDRLFPRGCNRIMRRIVVMNQKGGVGKTTTTANLGGALSRQGWRVLLVDMDPQAHLSIHFGYDPESPGTTIYDVLTDGRSLREAMWRSTEGLMLVPSCLDLAAAEDELSGRQDRFRILRRAVDAVQEDFDVLLIDCPPALGLLTLNALTACYEVLIPLQPHFLALQGLMRLSRTVSLVRSRLNSELRIGGVVICMHDSGTLLSAEVISGLERILHAQKIRGDAWSDARIFQTRIRRNIKLAECPSHQVSIFEYAPKSHGAQDYAALASEIFGSSGDDATTKQKQGAVHDVEEVGPGAKQGVAAADAAGEVLAAGTAPAAEVSTSASPEGDTHLSPSASAAHR